MMMSIIILIRLSNSMHQEHRNHHSKESCCLSRKPQYIEHNCSNWSHQHHSHKMRHFCQKFITKISSLRSLLFTWMFHCMMNPIHDSINSVVHVDNHGVVGCFKSVLQIVKIIIDKVCKP